MAGIKHRTASVNGVDLHYVEAGSGPLILFIHGFPDFWRVWMDQLNHFARTHRAVAPDLRGFNLSSKPADVSAYRAKHLVEDIRQLILHLGEKRCVIVAHDWGGAAVWSFAAAYPEMVERLVIINSPHAMTFARELASNPAQQKASAYMNDFRRPGMEAVLAKDDFAKLFRMFGRGHNRALDEEERQAYLAAWSQPGAMTGGLNYYRASPLHPPTPEEPGPAALKLDPAMFRVAVPTLVIWGMADTALLPCLLDGLEEHVPDLAIHRMEGVTHWPMRERPDEVNRLIAEFVLPKAR
jgi:pimeloyl-ACP methyl ester carboxylesterase